MAHAGWLQCVTEASSATCIVYRGLRGLVVVRLSGRALAAQAIVLGSTPGDCYPFRFPIFRLITSKFSLFPLLCTTRSNPGTVEAA